MKKTYLSALLIGLTSTVGFSQMVQKQVMHQIESLEEGTGAPVVNNSPVYSTKVLGVDVWEDHFSSSANWTIDIETTASTSLPVPAGHGWNIGTTPVNRWYTNNGMGAAIVGNPAGNGYAHLNNGNYTGQNAGTQAVGVTYTLTSATLDIPNLPLNTSNEDAVLLTFKQFGALFNDGQTVEISTDGGNNFTEVYSNNDRVVFVGNNPSAIYANPETIVVNLAPYTTGNATQVQLRFKWTSRFASQTNKDAWTTFGWFIDDVVLSTLPTNELKLGKSWHGDIVNDWEYSMLPLSQTREIVAGVVVTNDGASPATAVISCDVYDANGIVASPSDISQVIGVGETDTIWFNTGFTPSANGVYHVEFSVPSDDIPTNNTSTTSTLTINNNLMAHDYGTSNTFGWSGTGANSAFADAVHSWGEIYKPTVTQDVYGMDVWIGSGTTAGTYLLAQVFQIDPNGTGDWIQQPLSSVLTQVEITVAASNVNALTKVVFPSAVQLVAGRSYIFELQKADGTTGTSFYIAGSDGNGEDDDNSAVGKGKYAAAPNQNLDTYFTGWDGGFYIRPNFQNTAGLVETTMKGISIYPNPTEGKLTVTNTNNYNNTIEIVNIAGQVIYTGTSNTTVSLDLNGNGSGVYFVNISNELGNVTEKVILK